MGPMNMYHWVLARSFRSRSKRSRSPSGANSSQAVRRQTARVRRRPSIKARSSPAGRAWRRRKTDQPGQPGDPEAAQRGPLPFRPLVPGHHLEEIGRQTQQFEKFAEGRHVGVQPGMDAFDGLGEIQLVRAERAAVAIRPNTLRTLERVFVDHISGVIRPGDISETMTADEYTCCVGSAVIGRHWSNRKSRPSNAHSTSCGEPARAGDLAHGLG